ALRWATESRAVHSAARGAGLLSTGRARAPPEPARVLECRRRHGAVRGICAVALRSRPAPLFERQSLVVARLTKGTWLHGAGLPGEGGARPGSPVPLRPPLRRCRGGGRR